MAEPYDVQIKGLAPLSNLFKALIMDMSTERLMSRIGNFVMTSIKDRTSQGMDVDFEKFLAYSPGHAKTRANKGLPTNVVDLFFYGSMMNAMTFDATDDQVTLYFSPTVGKGVDGKPSDTNNAEKAYYLHQKREFFALSEQDMLEAQQLAIDELDRLLKEK